MDRTCARVYSRGVCPPAREVSALDHPRALERLPERGRTHDLEGRPVEVAEARRRDDRAREAEALGLPEPRDDTLHAPQLAAEPELADEEGTGIRRATPQRRGDGDREAEVAGGLADAQPADEVLVDVVRAEREAGALREDGEPAEPGQRV